MKQQNQPPLRDAQALQAAGLIPMERVAERAPQPRPVERAAPQVAAAERPAPPDTQALQGEPRLAGDRRATALAQLARGIVRRAQG